MTGDPATILKTVFGFDRFRGVQAQVVDRVTGWSYDLGRWVNDVGPVRIAVVVTLALVVLGVALNQGQGRNRGGREEAKG